MTKNLITSITSNTQVVEISRDNPTVIIGERINPTGRKKLLNSLKEGNYDVVRSDALSQIEAGAHILDVNAGVPGVDEVPIMKAMIKTITEVTDVPLCIDTADPISLEAALSIYEGKALINSINGEEEKMESILPLVKNSMLL